MDYIEEKTPKGITIKVILPKWKFIAFDRKGKSIYTDEHNVHLLHKVPIIVFIGEDFHVRNNYSKEISFLKVRKDNLIIPYKYKSTDNQEFIFTPYTEATDLLPVRLMNADNLQYFIKDFSSTANQPDFVIIDNSITKNDIIVIKNRCQLSRILLADNKKKKGASLESEKLVNPDPTKRASDLTEDIDINMISQNPVFLARIHLRKLDLNRVKQLLLDFNLSDIEIRYITSFLNTMLKRAETSEDLRKEKSNLESLQESFSFYLHLIKRNEVEILQTIKGAKNDKELNYYNTLLAKMKLLFPRTDDQLSFTTYENLILEIKEKLQSKE